MNATVAIPQTSGNQLYDKVTLWMEEWTTDNTRVLLTLLNYFIKLSWSMSCLETYTWWDVSLLFRNWVFITCYHEHSTDTLSNSKILCSWWQVSKIHGKTDVTNFYLVAFCWIQSVLKLSYFVAQNLMLYLYFLHLSLFKVQGTRCF